MSGRTPILGVHATLQAKPEQKKAVWDFLAGGKAIVDQEPDTLQWFAFKLDDTPDGELGDYGIFDNFPSAAGRDAHVNGAIPAALIPKVPELLSKAPALDPIDVIASKVSSNAATEGELPKWALATIVAKPESAAQIKTILTGTYAAAIREETVTHYWYAFQKNETTFGLCGAWHTEKDREDHLTGPAVAAMAAAVSPLSTTFVVNKGSVIAQKTHG